MCVWRECEGGGLCCWPMGRCSDRSRCLAPLLCRMNDIPLTAPAHAETLCLLLKACGRLLRWSVVSTVPLEGACAAADADPESDVPLLRCVLDAASAVMANAKLFAGSHGRDGKAAMAALYTSSHKVGA